MKNPKNAVGFSLAFLMLFVPCTFSQTTTPIDSRANYLRTFDDPRALNAVPINLDALGVRPGDDITISTVGDFSWCWPSGCPEGPAPACGVFSANATLLAGNVLNRVPGAKTFLGGGNACSTGATLFGNLPTVNPGTGADRDRRPSIQRPMTTIAAPSEVLPVATASAICGAAAPQALLAQA